MSFAVVFFSSLKFVSSQDNYFLYWITTICYIAYTATLWQHDTNSLFTLNKVKENNWICILFCGSWMNRNPAYEVTKAKSEPELHQMLKLLYDTTKNRLNVNFVGRLSIFRMWVITENLWCVRLLINVEDVDSHTVYSTTLHPQLVLLLIASITSGWLLTKCSLSLDSLYLQNRADVAAQVYNISG